MNTLLQNMDLPKYEKKFQTLVNYIGKNAETILEVGSHYGEDSIRFRYFFPQSNLYCFECDPRNIEIFEKYCKEINNIKLIKKAVSKNETTLDFYQSFKPENINNLPDKYKFINKNEYNNLKLNASGSSSLKKSNFEHLKNSTKIQVETISLNKFYEQENIDVVDLLWIDVQGAEKDVLDGANNILHKVKYIQIEYGELIYEDALTRENTIDYMKKYNFKLLHDWNPNSSIGDFLFKNNNILL